MAAPPQEHNFQLIRNLRVADYVTLSNGVCGALSIFCSMEQRFITAYVLIFIGYEFDRFDGIVARMRNECSEMGKQLDSLCDLVSFIVSPVVMLYCLGFQTRADQLALVFYVLCGIARLARFNIASHLIPRDANGKALYHQGLPTPYAALVVVTAVAVSVWLDWTSEDLLLRVLFTGTWYELHPAVLPVFYLGAMMISNRFKLRLDGGISIPAWTVVILASCWSYAPRRF